MNKAKLHSSRPGELLRGRFPFNTLPSVEVYLRYANFDFGSVGSSRPAARIVGPLRPPKWSKQRTFQYLKQHQEPFRACLNWLADDAALETNYSSTYWDGAVKAWNEHPPLKFLQLHGLTHGGVDLSFRNMKDGFFYGLELVQKRARDPLDFICWYLLCLLMWEETLPVGKCRFNGCSKFFEASRNKRFCSDLCRAKFHAAKLPPEQKRDYMRKYRQNPFYKRRLHG